MKEIALLIFLLGPPILAEEKVKINAMNANAALRSVLFAFTYKSFCARPIELDSKQIIPASVDFLKTRKVLAVWGSPENRSDSQLLKAFLGTRLTCSSVTKDSDDKTRVRIQSECVVSRREIQDSSKELTFQNTKDKVLWDEPSPEQLVLEREVSKQIQSQLNSILEQFIAKYQKDEFKTSLAEAYQKLVK